MCSASKLASLATAPIRLQANLRCDPTITQSSSNRNVFISYAQADSAWVNGYLMDALAHAGIHCFTHATLTPGKPILSEVETLVQQSQRTLIIYSSAYRAEKSLVDFTDQLAQFYGLETSTWPVIPVVLDNSELPLRLKMLTSLNATSRSDWQNVVEGICRSLDAPLSRSIEPITCPYPGMKAFTEKDNERFFGREREIQDMLLRLRQHSLLAVIGKSGCGKSSLLHAGLVPALQASTLFGQASWAIVSLRPGATPLDELTKALGSDPCEPAKAIDTVLTRNPQAQRVLLVIDQFEEIFSPSNMQAAPFQTALIGLAQISNCFVVLAIRSDFYSDLQTSPIWNDLKPHLYDILPLDDTGLREAIVKPAETTGVFIAPALVERLIADADTKHQPGILPFVQETLVLLWEHLDRRYLSLDAYEHLPLLSTKANGSRTGLQVAMALLADNALAQLREEQQRIARRIFLRIIQFGEGRPDTRRQQPISALQIANEDLTLFDATLRHLSQNRLLTVSGEENVAESKVDLSHEALIDGWHQLQTWIKEHKQFELTRRRFQTRAAEWIRLERRGGLLDETELQLALAWLNTANLNGLGIDADVHDFIRTSQVMVCQTKRLQWQRPIAAALIVVVALAAGYFAYREWLRQDAIRSSPQVQIEGGIATIGLTPQDFEQHREYALLDPGILQNMSPTLPITLPSFKIDQHEVTNQQYCLCRQAAICLGGPERVCQDEPSKPVTMITLRQSNDFCEWIGRRLPTEFEWEWAARGTERRLYPTGDTVPIGTHIYLSGTAELSEPKSITLSTPDRTPEGVLDLTGNVREWTASPNLQYEDRRYLSALFPNNTSPPISQYVTRGGSFQGGIYSAIAALRNSNDDIFTSIGLGFRCITGPPLTDYQRR